MIIPQVTSFRDLCNGEIPSKAFQISGVFRGSCKLTENSKNVGLGPVLFTIYVHNMQHSSNLQPWLFVDDTYIFMADVSIDHVIQKTNHEAPR